MIANAFSLHHLAHMEPYVWEHGPQSLMTRLDTEIAHQSQGDGAVVDFYNLFHSMIMVFQRVWLSGRPTAASRSLCPHRMLLVNWHLESRSKRCVMAPIRSGS